MNTKTLRTAYAQSLVKQKNHHGETFEYLDHVKFAECLIKECIQLVEDHYWSDPHEVYEAMDLIRNHFGVKND